MTQSLKKKAISGVFWNGFQQIATKIIVLITNIFFARLLSEEDFGCMGIIYVFIAVATIFTDSGLGVALVQKRNVSEKDYSTVFITSLLISILCYIILFFSSDAIAIFYSVPILTKLLKVFGITLILGALVIVPYNIMVKRMMFRDLALNTTVSSIVGGTIGIICAFKGYGVWSLIINTLVTKLSSLVLFIFQVRWFPKTFFKWSSFKELFGFGSMLLLSNLVITVYNNILSLIIGKVYKMKDLGYYTQAKKMEEVPIQSLALVVQQVTLPIFSSISDDKERFNLNLKKVVSSISFISFPMITLLLVMARPIFHILFTAKWDNSIIYFQILCCAGYFLPFTNINSNILASLGKSKLILRAVLINKILGIILIFIALKFWGIIGMLWCMVLNAVINYIIEVQFSNIYIRYNLWKQLKDIAPAFILSFVSGVISYLAGYYINVNDILLLLIQTAIFVSIFISFGYLFRIQNFISLLKDLKSLIKKR